MALVAALGVVMAVAVLTIIIDPDDGPRETGATTITVDMFEFGFEGELIAPAGPVRLDATNTGRIGHNIGLRRGPISNEVAPGASTMLDLGPLEPGTYELYCDIVGHVDAGMVAALTITEAATATSTAA